MEVFSRVANEGRLTLGLVFPLESYRGSIPTMKNQEELARKAEMLGFKALWFRDVPFNDPSFGDAGQLYDPWIYMTHIMNQTNEIALATGSIILPLRHPVHTVKSMNSLQLLSDGRLILGIASGDRPIEYPAFNQDLGNRSLLFRDSFYYIKSLQKDFPDYHSKFYGKTNGAIDLLPKYRKNTPMLVTGHSGQSLNWIAKNSDGWLYYPRDFKTLDIIMQRWRLALSEEAQGWKPFIQSLYIDLVKDPDAGPSSIHLGFKSGRSYFIDFLKQLESQGVNHVILNLKYGSRSTREVIEEIGEQVLVHFS